MSRIHRRGFLKSGLTATLGAFGAGISLWGGPAQSSEDRHTMTGPQRRELPPGGNPIMPGIGLCDPHARCFDGRIYLYATHDASPNNPTYHMNDWWIWSTSDLVHWDQVSVLKPEQTYLRRPFSSCWATDAAFRNGRYYFYFSAGPEEIGVVLGTSPAGPWKDPLRKPLIPKGLVPTEARDPGILMDDDGSAFIVFGTFYYYIARLGDDMISLAEPPRLVEFDRKFGPYGGGKTDDKPYLHRRGGIYYLSWGCFYATADNPYGPYSYKGCIITPETTAPSFRNDHLYMDRHSSFFEIDGQWYIICNDYSNNGASAYFRNSILAYVHYRDSGEIAPIRIDSTGVGRYDCAAERIEAEDYSKITGGSVRECPSGGFEVRGLRDGSVLLYRNVENVPPYARLTLRLSSQGNHKGRLEIRENGVGGKLFGHAAITPTENWNDYRDLHIPLISTTKAVNLAFIFRGEGAEFARLDSWRIEDAKST
jgi:hypothetical protein